MFIKAQLSLCFFLFISNAERTKHDYETDYEQENDYANFLDNYMNANQKGVHIMKSQQLQDIVGNFLRRTNQRSERGNEPLVFLMDQNPDKPSTPGYHKNSAIVPQSINPPGKSLNPAQSLDLLREPFRTEITSGLVVDQQENALKTSEPTNIDLLVVSNKLKNNFEAPLENDLSKTLGNGDNDFKSGLTELRSRWRSKCDKAASKQCKKACKKALKWTCAEYKCKSGLKKEFKRNCKRICQNQFLGDRSRERSEE